MNFPNFLVVSFYDQSMNVSVLAIKKYLGPCVGVGRVTYLARNGKIACMSKEFLFAGIAHVLSGAKFDDASFF